MNDARPSLVCREPAILSGNPVLVPGKAVSFRSTPSSLAADLHSFAAKLRSFPANLSQLPAKLHSFPPKPRSFAPEAHRFTANLCSFVPDALSFMAKLCSFAINLRSLATNLYSFATKLRPFSAPKLPFCPETDPTEAKMGKIKAVVEFGGDKATGSGIMPGTTVWVRVRAAGLKSVMGAWSDPTKAESDDSRDAVVAAIIVLLLWTRAGACRAGRCLITLPGMAKKATATASKPSVLADACLHLRPWNQSSFRDNNAQP